MGGGGAGTHQTVGTWCVVDVDPVVAVVRVKVFTPVLVEAAAATHADDGLGKVRASSTNVWNLKVLDAIGKNQFDQKRTRAGQEGRKQTGDFF